MFRILLILGLVTAGSVLAADSEDAVERYRAYFKSLDLPYVNPRDCSADAPCSVVGDFNDDGVDDLATLYEFAGDENRRADWNVDLVILYSQANSAEPAHMVFTRVGQVGEKREAPVSLAVQGAGKMRVPAGEITLDRPGINVFYGAKRGPSQFLTFYWRGESFYAVDKSDD